MRRNWVLAILFIGLLNLIFMISWFVFPGWRSHTVGVWELIGASILAAITVEGLIIGWFKDFRDWLFPKVDQTLITAPIQPTTLENILADATLGGWVKYINRNSTKPSDLSAYSRIVIIAPRKMGKSREAAELISHAAGDLFLPTRIFTPSSVQVKLLDRNAIQRQLKLEPQITASHAPILLYIDDLPNEFKGKDLASLTNLLDALGVFIINLYVVATARENYLSPDDLAWLAHNQFKMVHLPPLDAPQAGQLVDYYSAAEKIEIDEDARQVLINRSDGTPELILRSLRRMKDAGFSRFTRAEADKLTLASLDETTFADMKEFAGSHPAAPPLLDTLAEFYSASLDPQINLVMPFTIAGMHSSPRLRTSSQRLKALRRLVAELSGMYLSVDRDRILIKDTLVEHIVDQNHARRHLAEFFLSYRRTYQNRYLRRMYPMAGQHAMALFALALNAQNFDSYLQAVKLYSAAITLMPHFGFYNNRGTTYHNLQNYPAALADYTRAIELDPQFAAAYHNRGVTYAKQQDYKAALADFANAIKLDPGYASAYNNRGAIYANQQDFSGALDDFTRAIELDPYKADAWYGHGVALARLNEPKQAIESYDRALAIDSQKVEAWYNRGIALATLGEQEQAIESYDCALKIDPLDAGVWYNRGIALTELGKPKQAVESYEQALAIDPKNADVQYNLACAFALIQDEYHACKWLKLSIQSDKKYVAIAQDEAKFALIRQGQLFQDLLMRSSSPTN
jgi:tetratricopeptide (TPR) repeat protein